MKDRKIKGLLALACTVSMGLAGCAGGSRGDDSSSSNVDSTGTSDTGGSGTVDGVLSLADQSEVSDLNIYFTSTNPTADQQNWVWAWNDDDESFAFPAYTEQTRIYGIGTDDDNILFTQVHITFGQAYQAWSQWDIQDLFETTMTVPDQNLFTYIIFRSADGSKQSDDISIEPSMIQKDDQGHYNIYIDGDKGQTYYSISDFPVSPVKQANYGEANKIDGSSIGWIDLVGTRMSEVFPYFDDSTIQVKAYRYNPDNGNKNYKNSMDPDIAYSYCEVTSDTSARIYFESSVDISWNYEVWVMDPNSKNIAYACDISYTDYFNTSAFDAKYYTDEQLGAVINDDGTTTFKLWSPTAMSASVTVYKPDSEGHPSDEVYDSTFLTEDDHGVWSSQSRIEGDVTGYYYVFSVTNFGIRKDNVPDPYALSSSANGEMSMVVDFDKVKKPAGYENYQNWAPDYKNFAGVTIMEMHTRDVTSDSSWNGDEANRGKFNGLVESGTTLPDGTATGFDYIKELGKAGLTHVQIMPAFDFASVDETKLDDPDYQNAATSGIYNWGYDPQQYNAPEGSYSSDPDNGNTRVEEFMNFVNEYNANGIGVVMDVVYNHMPGQAGSSFEQVFPGYYFRDVSVSGAGSDIASQRSMVRQFIVDSVTMWAKEYHVSGFRFDLMGILDIKTMKAVRQALDEINPNILVYGEGWQMFNDSTDPSTGLGAADMAYQGSLNYMGEDWVGSFNDDVRDAIKGQQSGDASWVPQDRGYAQNAILGGDSGTMAYQKSKIYYGLTGTLGYGIDGRPIYNSSAHDGVGASVCYTECHDNLTLWDKLTMSTPVVNRDLVEDMARMANSTVLSALSSSFFEIGQDFGRSKSFTDEKFKANTSYFEDPYCPGIYYSHNSYNLSDEVNGIDWTLLDTHSSMESDFRRMLSERKEGSLAMDTYLGRNMTFDDFGANGTVDGIYQSGLEGDNAYVISFKINMPDGKTYLNVQNYSTSDFTYDGHTVPARSSAIIVY